MPLGPHRGSEAPRLQWHWNVKLIVLCSALLPLTLAAGFWQLRRAEEKRDLLAAWQQRLGSEPVALETVEPRGDNQYLRVFVTGLPDQAHQFLVDNRLRRGRAGYEVLMPVQFDKDAWILVNRGWLPRGDARDRALPIPPLTQSGRLVGHLYRAAKVAPVLGPEEPGASWPQVIQQPEPGLLARRFGHQLFPYQLRLEESPGFDVDWPVVGLSPQQHLGYAVQWFGLSGVLVVLGVISNSNLPEWWRARRRRSHG
jgi:cytochrome oxidase assembly protein ShyY1